jgi:2'-5' RNA ligase
MSVRSRAALLEAPVAKGFGSGIPPAIEAAEARSQMTPTSPFSPGEPIGPYDGFSRTPRSHDYVTGYNIATRPRTHERVAFETLKGLFGSYDVARICVRHRIASLRSLDYKLVSADGFEGDVSAEVAEGKRVLKRPDGKTLFKPWLAKYLRGVLSYDAGTLYRMRNRAGRAVGLSVVDGTLIAPLQDYWGNPPDAPAPAYVQYVNGLPWNWLTRDDLVYEPYDPQDDSLYGTAPLEDILLNANTDIRFQLYFLERFTSGNLPAGFASSPDAWSPDQIEQFQEYWDAFMLGDQSRKHQIRWIPSGSKLAWTNEKDFTDSFSLFLMRKTCSAYSIVPSDLGFTESVNKSSGESQADVQHRVGDLPMALHVQDILTAFLQDDLQLPLKFAFDLGEEQDDRVDQANADDTYMKMGVVGPSEIRELRYGWSDPEPIPRFIYTERAGPIPVSSLLAVAGETDPATELPVPGAPLPKEVFGGTEGVLPNPPIKVMSLAEREFGEAAMPPAPPPQPKMTPADAVPDDDSGTVAKEGEAAGGNVTAGITAETGLYSYDLDGRDDDDDGPVTLAPQAEVAKEMQAFRRFAKARRKSGEWRDFEFAAVSSADARRLNEEGRGSVAKAASGYELSPRSGMISLDLPDGTIEPVPGGVGDFHVTVVYLGPDVTDDAFAAACDRARQAAALVPGPLSGTVSGVGCFPPSAGSDGKVPAWAAIAIPGAEKLRDALADLSASEHRDWTPHVTLAYLDPGDPLPAPLEPVPVTFGYLSVHRGEDVQRFPLGGEGVAKAGGARPKRPRPSGDGRPVASGDHVVNRLLMDAERGGQVLDGLTGKAATADLPHLVVGQLEPVAVGLGGGAEESPDSGLAQLTGGVPFPAGAGSADGRLLDDQGGRLLDGRPPRGSLGLGAGLRGGRGLPGGRPSHGPDLRGGEPEVPAGALLKNPVGAVGLVGAEKQVSRPHAGRVVAQVADEKPVGDGSVDELPRDAVGKHRLASGLAGLLDPENAVVTPVGIPGGHPFPASGRLVDLGPETGSGGVVNSRSHQVSVSKADWHGWTLDRKTAAYWAPQVRDAVTAAVPREKARQIGAGYLAAHPKQDGKAPEKRDRNKAAAAWLAKQGITFVPASLAQGIVTDGYAIGAMSAAHAVTGQAPGSQVPGDEKSALGHVEAAGLAAVLAALLQGGNGTDPAAEVAAEQIASGYLGSLAIILAGTDADWADSGETLDELGGVLSDALADEDTAVTLVGTVINVYTGLAANAYYLANSVAWGSWENAGDARVCPSCLANTAAGPVLIGQPYPSGDAYPPAHPGGCRCAVVPSGPPGS